MELVDLAVRASTAYDRPDLTGRLEHTRRRLEDPNVRVLVVGEFKQGKSQLVNALINAPVCPVDDDLATAVPTAVLYAEKPSVTLVWDGEQRRRSDVPVAKLADYVSEAGNPGNRQGLARAEVGLPRNLLKDGLVLVDTPGVGGLGSAHGAATMATLPTADAVLLVSDASQEYTAPELEFLATAMRLCPNVAGVITKTDLYPQWRRITDLDRGHLAGAGITAELFPVSSVLRLEAVRSEDAELNEESGFAALVTYLRKEVLARTDDLDRRSTSQDVLAVADQLAASMRAELAAQRDPQRAGALVSELEIARGRAMALKDRSARWQHTLNDGVQDLAADIEHDLRDRLRAIGREADSLLDAADPADIWDQFGQWLEGQVATATSANFVWAGQRAEWLAGQVAEHFAAEGDSVLPALHTGRGEMGGQVQRLERPEQERIGLGQKLYIGARGGYGGMLMIGLATTLAGFAMLNPLSIGAGLLFGAKTVREEQARQLARRTSEAKAAVRKHLDEVTFQVGKDSRDMLRQVQRQLRDHFTSLAEELQTSVDSSVKAAQKAVSGDENVRQARIRDLEAELARIAKLEDKARALVPGARKVLV
ncbi:dynamin family protein [Pseudonocardia sp. KRD-184]|uniref:Dynamin family protein n=2 Tax=Pseudonocardia oceani TaxID=2792013 RepID=A0ABS6UA83_9PSEU|nr:dynamin family protein [Pseudonocardia oceani]MBW0097516.1 dynamin family protein [Pseudonocardia oceani]MBW0110120.1 dynamin family protein [Pseudonocardia oceani]MBW0122354.1 dynamin family protein [Pseudonocardia oceani]MBW0129155.1 dynamin family protein [Pseudonocardia oceani]